MLLIEDTKTGTRTQNIARISLDGVTQATLVTDIINNEDIVLKLYLGKTLTDDCWTLSFDFGAAARPVPTGAVTVTAEEFLTRLEAAFTPAQQTPNAPGIPTPPSSAN